MRGWGGGWAPQSTGGWDWNSSDVNTQVVAAYGRGSSQAATSAQVLRDQLFASPEAIDLAGFRVKRRATVSNGRTFRSS